MMQANTPGGMPLGIQPPKGGGGSRIAQILLSVMGKGAAPTANQTTALNAGAGPVNAGFADKLVNGSPMPLWQQGGSAPANPLSSNPYYLTGFHGKGMY